MKRTVIRWGFVLFCMWFPVPEMPVTGNFNHRYHWCDTFDYPDGTQVYGWTEHSGDWTIADHQLVSPGNTETHCITSNYASITGDACVTVRVFYQTASAGQYGAAMVWYEDIDAHLCFRIQDNAGAGFFDSCGLYQNGEGSLESGLNFGPSPIIQLEVIGSTAWGRVDVDADQVWDHVCSTEVTPAAGECGLAHTGPSIVFDTWCGGDECGMPSPTPSVIPCIHHGDVTLDGELTAGDAQLAFLIALGAYSPEWAEWCAADCDNTWEVTAADAQEIFLAVLGSGACYDPL